LACREGLCGPGKKVEIMSVVVRGLLAGALVLVLVCGCTAKEESDKATGQGVAPLFALKDLEGNTVRLKDLRGKVVLLNFFATWCGPCRQEISDLVGLDKKFHSKGLQVIGISLDMEGAAVLHPFVRRYGITYPVVLGDRQVVLDYGGIRGIPTSFLIDRNGMVIKHFVGFQPGQVIEAAVVELLEAKVAGMKRPLHRGA
jgi:cytochrome c biogenesis protein CcmG/thiol:disulfide interchange protein DsbE